MELWEGSLAAAEHLLAERDFAVQNLGRLEDAVQVRAWCLFFAFSFRARV